VIVKLTNIAPASRNLLVLIEKPLSSLQPGLGGVISEENVLEY
jgi:hypothetical protein